MHLKKYIIKSMISLLAVIFVVLMFGKNVTINAQSDLQGSLYGVSVDNDVYNVSWDSERVSNCYYSGKSIGVSYIYIGKAVANEQVDGKYVVTYLVVVKTCPQKASYSKKVLWWTNKWTEYGYNTKCEISAVLSGDQSLVTSLPKYSVSDTSYSIGGGIGVDSSGLNGSISGSVNYTSEALNISNSSSTSDRKVDIKINLNQSIFRWDWKRYKYAQQENIQLFSFTTLTSNTSYSQPITINTQYATADSNANWWMEDCGHYGAGSYYASTNVKI